MDAGFFIYNNSKQISIFGAVNFKHRNAIK